jgi:hypothetical protein
LADVFGGVAGTTGFAPLAATFGSGFAGFDAGAFVCLGATFGAGFALASGLAALPLCAGFFAAGFFFGVGLAFGFAARFFGVALAPGRAGLRAGGFFLEAGRAGLRAGGFFLEAGRAGLRAADFFLEAGRAGLRAAFFEAGFDFDFAGDLRAGCLAMVILAVRGT